MLLPSGALAVVFFFWDWAGVQGKFMPLTTRYFSDIWCHFPFYWFVFWVVFVALSALSDRLSR